MVVTIDGFLEDFFAEEPIVEGEDWSIFSVIAVGVPFKIVLGDALDHLWNYDNTLCLIECNQLVQIEEPPHYDSY